MAHFSTVLERLQHLAPPHHLDNPWLCCPNRYLPLEHGDSRFQMVPVAVALRMVRCRDHGKGAGSNHTHLCPLGTCYTTITSISSVTMKAWLLLSAKAPQKTQLWCTFYIPCGFSLHTLTSPLQLHTYQEQQIQLLTTSLVEINISSPVQPSLVSTSNSLTTLNLPYCLPTRSRLDFSSIPAAVPRNLNITSPDMNKL